MKRQTVYIILAGLLVMGIAAAVYVRQRGGTKRIAQDAVVSAIESKIPKPAPNTQPRTPNDVAPQGGSFKDRIGQTVSTTIHENRGKIFNKLVSGAEKGISFGVNRLKQKRGTKQNSAAVSGVVMGEPVDYVVGS